jgi:anti-anti-sigma factor
MLSSNTYFRAQRVDAAPGVRLALHGELDRATLLALAPALRELEREAQDGIVLDLTELTFVDVGGLKLILETARRLRATGRQLTLANSSPSVRRLLELTAIDQTADVVDEVAPAPAT